MARACSSLSALVLDGVWTARAVGRAREVGREARRRDARLQRAFAFGPNHSFGFIPVGFIEFGFNPSVGVYGFWNDAFVKGNDIRLHYELWPSEWFGGSLTDRFRIDSERAVQLRIATTKRPDHVFYGIGPDTPQWHQSTATTWTSSTWSGTIESKAWRSSSVRATVGVRKVDLFGGHYGKDPSLEDEARSGAFDVPFGFNRGYLGPYSDLRLIVDSRKRDVPRGSSARFEIEGEHGSDVEHAPATGWVRYGANAGVFVDLNGHARILSLQVAALFADPLGNGQIPFTELVTLGGDIVDAGILSRPPRRSKRRTVAQLAYTWPVGPKLDATMQADVGNVFGDHLQDFDPRLLRLSAAFGLEAHVGDPPLQFLVGFGTEPIDRGLTVDSFRVMVGVPRTF